MLKEDKILNINFKKAIKDDQESNILISEIKGVLKGVSAKFGEMSQGAYPVDVKLHVNSFPDNYFPIETPLIVDHNKKAKEVIGSVEHYIEDGTLRYTANLSKEHSFYK